MRCQSCNSGNNCSDLVLLCLVSTRGACWWRCDRTLCSQLFIPTHILHVLLICQPQELPEQCQQTPPARSRAFQLLSTYFEWFTIKVSSVYRIISNFDTVLQILILSHLNCGYMCMYLWFCCPDDFRSVCFRWVANLVHVPVDTFTVVAACFNQGTWSQSCICLWYRHHILCITI